MLFRTNPISFHRNLVARKAVLGDRNRCLKCGEMFGDANRENIKHACRDCGKFEVSEEMREKGNIRCNECDSKHGLYLQEKLEEDEQKKQQITNLQEENKTLNQQLEIECQAKEEAEKGLEKIKAQQEQARIELVQLREELTKTQKQLEKSPELNTKQLIEKLRKSNQDLAAYQKLVQKPKLNHQEIAEVKNQLDNSRQVLVAAAAHTQQVEKKTPQLQTQAKLIEVQEQPNRTNYFPYLVSGLVLLLGSFLVIGYWLGSRVTSETRKIKRATIWSKNRSADC